jgi:VIT1/CCC1 family predicted Fe2+/Mn2+ transporter
MSGTKVIAIVFIWVASWSAAIGLTHQTKFDWIASVLLYGGLLLLPVLVASEDAQQKQSARLQEARPTFARLALIFSSMAVWLGSMLGVLTLLPGKDSITFTVWIVWGAMLILFFWRLEKHWKRDYR